jgi:hypothetical protein
LQAEIATPIGVNATYKSNGDLDKAASGGIFWLTPSGYASSTPIIDAATGRKDSAGTKYGSGSSVFTQTSTSATA